VARGMTDLQCTSIRLLTSTAMWRCRRLAGGAPRCTASLVSCDSFETTPAWHACRWLGVRQVYLTDNAHLSEGEQLLAPQLQDFITDGFLTYTHDPTPGLVFLTRWRCVNAARGKHQWMAFIDMDEFIVLRDPCAPVPLPRLSQTQNLHRAAHL
jgi:hypothetical protein